MKRIQRQRTKGWRKPEGVISVTRPGKWGNPFTVGIWFRNISGDWNVWSRGDSPHFGNRQVQNLEHSLELFAEYATKHAARFPEWLEPLRGHDLMCWCNEASQCHADILLALANPTEQPL